VHLAGTSNLPDSEHDTVFSVNVQGTVNLLEACERLAERPRKIILASSSYVYGDTGLAPASEDAPLRPRGAYGKSKCEMERAAARWFDRMPVLLVRPFNYTGVGHGRRFLVPKIVRAFRERAEDVSFVDPNSTRDYSDVGWVASVYVDLLKRQESGLAINVCSGVGTSLPSLVALLEELTGHSPSARPGQASGRKTALVGNPTLLLSLLGKPSPHSLVDTLRWMLQSEE
jgi:nucleoside-diphosphate-sugar epimerase